jgi:hypothetical protein
MFSESIFRTIIFSFLFIQSFNLTAQSVRIFGKIQDKLTGETLIGANIINTGKKD